MMKNKGEKRKIEEKSELTSSLPLLVPLVPSFLPALEVPSLFPAANDPFLWEVEPEVGFAAAVWDAICFWSAVLVSFSWRSRSEGTHSSHLSFWFHLSVRVHLGNANGRTFVSSLYSVRNNGYPRYPVETRPHSMSRP
jgi:hypothetical protein